MSTSGPDDTPPPSELQGLDPKDLLQAGLETVLPVTLPPQPVDSDATIPVARPQSTQPAPQVELPLPEELTQLLPAGAYHVESFLGQGGMGAVYKASQVRLKRPVAIKIMRRDMGKDYDFEARFEREAQAMAKLNHPNIVSVIDFGEAGADYLYIVMELIDGADLMDVIRGGQMTQEMALTLLPQVCDALQFAHDHGIVHRDIKPSNIMLTRDGRVKMCDFGLAKRYDVESSFRTQTGTGMGTPDYAAPEQFDPKANIDHRADIYALGVMIYQMITGQLPRGVWKPPSQRAAIAPQWDDIVSRAMQSDPSDRYQQASEVKTDVSSIALVGRSTDIPVRAPSNPPPSGASQGTDKRVRSTSRTPLLFGLIVGTVVIAIGAFFVLKKPAQSGPLTPVSGTSNAKAPAAPPRVVTTAKPAAAVSTSPSLPVTKSPITVPALPESGWKPLFTEAEWRASNDDCEFVEGLLHIKQRKFHPKTQPTADGAIRARIIYREGTRNAFMVARGTEAEGQYVLGLGTDAKHVFLGYFKSLSSEGNILARHFLPRPLASGDGLSLELILQGDHLIGLLNGAPVIDAHDTHLNEPGRWGIYASPTGWFESVEVQSLPAATAGPWQDVLRDPKKLSLAPMVAWTPEGLRFTGIAGASLGTGQGPQRDGAVRMRTAFGAVRPRLTARQNKAGDKYMLSAADATRVTLYCWDQAAKKSALKREFSLRVPLQPGQDYELELRVVGQTFTAKCNGETLGTVNDGTIAEGAFGVLVGDGGGAPVLVKSLEFLDLYAPGKVTASPSVPVSKSSATKDAPFINTLGMKFVPVPGTKALFSIWHTRVQDYAEFAKVQEAAGKKVDSSWKTAHKGGVPIGRESDHPVSSVTWEEAQAFCQWLTTKEQAEGKLTKAQRYRLPTDTEWSTAVGLPPEQGSTPEAKQGKSIADFPWGKEWPPTRPVGNYADESFHTKFPVTRDEKENRDVNLWLEGYNDGHATTSPVGIFPVNAQGLYDMGGNVWQWCEDWHSESQTHRVLRGASYGIYDRIALRSSYRYPSVATERGNHGFRCVLELAPSAAAVSPSPNLTASKSSDPKFPPGQWVKLITKPEDLPADLRKSDSGIKWENGWIKGARQLLLSSDLAGNYGVRATFKHSSQASDLGRLVIRYNKQEAHPLYQVGLGGDFQNLVLQNSKDWKKFTSLWSEKIPKVAEGAEYKMELAAVGNRLITRFGDLLCKITDIKDAPDGAGQIIGTEDIRDIEVINLDGLPEADALRLLGVDEQGNDLRGKTSTTSMSSTPAAGAVLNFGGHRYQFVAASMTWSEAKVKAAQMGGHLATFGSSEEWETARSMILEKAQPQAVWLGGYRDASNQWKWITGEPWSFTSWAKKKNGESEPSNSNGPENCLEARVDPTALRHYDWNDMVDRAPTHNLSTGYLVEWDNSEVASSSASATKAAPFINTLGMKFAPVPGTKVLFCMHETRYQDYLSYAAETKVAGDAWKDQTADGFTPTTNTAEHPVMNVSWQEAKGFCEWLSKKEGVTYRLPTDEEWSLAVGLAPADNQPTGTTPDVLSGRDKSSFPWGGDFPPKTADLAGNYGDASKKAKAPRSDIQYLEAYDDGFPTTAPVMSFKPNAFGLYDLGGNVWEWCEDWIDDAHQDRVLRGASWLYSDRAHLLSSHRGRRAYNDRSYNDGFRVVLVQP